MPHLHENNFFRGKTAAAAAAEIIVGEKLFATVKVCLEDNSKQEEIGITQ